MLPNLGYAFRMEPIFNQTSSSGLRSARVFGIAATLFAISGCATPYDVPLPTMVGTQRAYSMSGVMSTSYPEKVRAKVLRIMATVCSGKIDLVQFRTEPVSRHVIKNLHYEAVATCKG